MIKLHTMLVTMHCDVYRNRPAQQSVNSKASPTRTKRTSAGQRSPRPQLRVVSQ